MTELSDELRDLGRDLGPDRTGVRAADDLADRVMARVTTLDPLGAPAAPSVVRHPWRSVAGAPWTAARALARSVGRRWRRWLAGLGALLLAFAVTVAVAAPVRAAIGRAFGFGGVQIRPEAGPSPVPSPTLPGEHGVDLAGAARVVGFPVRVPAALGPPDSVSVADGRVVTLRWTASAVQLDEFNGGIGYYWDKYTQGGLAQRVTVAGHEGLWFPGPITLVYVDAAGRELPGTARETTATLLWTDGPLTLRLDGIRSLDAALAAATTMR